MNWAVSPHKREGAFAGTAIFQTEGMTFIDSWQMDLLLAFWNENNFLLRVFGNIMIIALLALKSQNGREEGKARRFGVANLLFTNQQRQRDRISRWHNLQTLKNWIKMLLINFSGCKTECTKHSHCMSKPNYALTHFYVPKLTKWLVTIEL